MSRPDDFELIVSRATAKRHATLKDDLVRLRDDAGITRAAVARGARVDAAYLARIEDGSERPSIETYQRLAAALGADLSTRIYPNTGPTIRDRHQARILEVTLAAAHARWHAFLEVGVREPVRGSIDLALHDPVEGVLVATEIESELRRLEQQIRWSMAKANALPSWEGWAHLGQQPRISQLLIVRRTRVTRRAVSEFEQQIRTAYPAHPDDALAALTGTARWPGPAVVWALVEWPANATAARALTAEPPRPTAGERGLEPPRDPGAGRTAPGSPRTPLQTNRLLRWPSPHAAAEHEPSP